MSVECVKAAVVTPWWFERIVNNHTGKKPQGHRLNTNPSAPPLGGDSFGSAVTEPEDPHLLKTF